MTPTSANPQVIRVVKGPKKNPAKGVISPRSRQVKRFGGVRPCGRCELFDREVFESGQGLADDHDQGGLVRLTAVGHRRKKRRVRLNQELVERAKGGSSPHVS